MDTKATTRILGLAGVSLGIVFLITTLLLTQTVGIGVRWILMLALSVGCLWMGMSAFRYQPKVPVEPTHRVQQIHRLGTTQIRESGADVLGDKTRWWFGEILTPVHFMVDGQRVILTLSAGPNALGEHKVVENLEALPTCVVGTVSQLIRFFPNPRYVLERSGQRIRLKVILYQDAGGMLYLEDEFFDKEAGANFPLF